MMNEQRRYSRNVLQALTYPLMDVRLSTISTGMDITTDIAGNFSRAASLQSREYADAFLGGGFNYTSHAHTRPFGPAAHLGRRRQRTEGVPKKSRSNIPRVQVSTLRA